MKVRSLLVGFVLALMVLFTGISSTTASPAKADGCIYNCIDLYNACEASCNGDRLCLKQCQKDYNECACGCGLGGPCQ